MKRYKRKNLIITTTLILFLFTTISGNGQNLRLSVGGNIQFSGSAFTVTEAGENLAPSVESQGQNQISVEYSGSWLFYFFYPDKKWRIYVHKSDVNWNPDLSIEIKRTGTGSIINGWRAQSLYLSDGNNYRNITNTPSYFFRGRHGIINIPVQFRLNDISLLLGAQSFETSIVFTVYDDW